MRTITQAEAVEMLGKVLEAAAESEGDRSATRSLLLRSILDDFATMVDAFAVLVDEKTAGE